MRAVAAWRIPPRSTVSVADRNGRAQESAHYPAGSRLRILPNHAGAIAGAHAANRVVDGGTEVAAV
jgi:D-serine deaminase-like pyridoxal phosphate-dependent protein